MKKNWMNVCLVLIGSAVTLPLAAQITPITSARSEERRVGKECL